MKEFFTRDIGWKLLSLALAFVLWMGVVAETELTTTVSAPLEYQGIPTDLEISSNVPESIRLEVKGPSGKLNELSNVAVVLNLAGAATAGQRTFNISEANLNLPSRVTLNRSIPAQIRLTLDRKVRVELPVAVKLTGNPQPGHRVAGHSVQPEKLWVIGPESRVRLLDTLETDPVDVGDLIGAREFHVNTFARDPHVRIDGPSTVRVMVSVLGSAAK